MSKPFAAQKPVSRPLVSLPGPEEPLEEASRSAPTPPLRLQHDGVDVGSRLRAARLARHLTLADVAGVTKISARALEAIENNDVSRLPGGIFSRGFVKTYAEHLGLDGAEIVQAFLARFPEATPPEDQAIAAWEAHATVTAARDRISASVVGSVALGVAVVVAAAGLYWILSGPASPQQTQAAAPVDAAGSTTGAAIQLPPPDPALAPPPATMSGATAATAGSGGPATDLIDPESVVAAALAKDQMEVAIEAVAPCWVRVTIDGEVAFARVMRAGERETRVGSEQIVLDVGDAGALRYSINGVPGRWLGRKGQVITARISKDTLATFLQP